SLVALAQSVSTTYTSDINGRRAEADSVVSKDHQRTEVVENLNGRRIPLRQTDERVLRQDGSSKVTERVIRQFDRNGQLASTEREIVEEQSRGNGTTGHVTAYRTDVNGRMAEAERRTTETEKQGSVTRTQSSVDRPSLNGSFQTIEKRSAVTQESASGSQTD